MQSTRREFLALTGVAAAAVAIPGTAEAKGASEMYGLIGKINAVPGQRDALIDLLLEGTADMPGCLSYVVARDLEDPDALWVTEVWESQEHHKASLELPSVQDAMSRGKPLIEGFGERFETRPVGGHGLAGGSG